MTPRQRMEALGAGIFVRSRNVESRLKADDFRRAFEEPVIIRFLPGEYLEDRVVAVLVGAKKLHAIQCFRFPNTSVSADLIELIRNEFPNAAIEGLKKKMLDKTTVQSRRG